MSKGSLNLKADIDKRSGFCFGVVNAIRKAEDLLDKEEVVYCVGQIVHNDEEVNRLEKKGMITINHNDLQNIKQKNVLFRAHGEPPESYGIARKNDNRIIDASCPIILKLQKDIRKAYQNGDNIFIFGKHNHPEVLGLNGQIGYQATVIDSLDELMQMEIPEKLTLFSQTTMNLEDFYQVVDYLKNKKINVKVRDTICRQVSNRRGELQKFCCAHDRVVFVAGKQSSNGKMLYNICNKQNPNAHFISSASEIQKDWFNEEETIGITGATSTPMWLMEKVKEEIEAL